MTKEDEKLLEIINDEDEYAKLFKKYHPSEKLTEEHDKEYLEEYAKAFEESEKKWKLYELLTIKKCSHFGEVNIFNLVPITCNGFKTEELLKLIKEKNIKSWLILDIGCLLDLDIDKLDDLKFYFAPIDDFNVPSFQTMDNILEFISENTKIGNVLVSCTGGHGRTGTVLSIWAGLHDIEKPIKYIKEIYCEKAVETISQEMFVNIYLKYLRNL